MIRKPAVAGQFYPLDSTVLEKQLSTLLDKKAEKVDCLGAISPHAGYAYSGPVAGRVFSRMNPKKVFVILGPNHTGYGKTFSVMAKGSWQTPMGKADIDEELAEIMLKNSAYLEEDETAHAYEHSIEVQLPFLLYLKKDFKFVPVVVSQSGLDAYKKLGLEIAKSIKASGKDTVIIASSDMTHYEEHKSAKAKDKLAIDAVLKLDPDQLMKTVSENDISMCGCAPTIVMLAAAKELGAKKAELVDYKTSGDTSGDYSSVVGYAGIIVI